MTYDIGIDYSCQVAVTGGRSMTVSDSIAVGAIDVLRCTATKNGGTAELDITAEAIGTITFVSIVADNYADLAFQVGVGAPIVFDGPVMLVGSGQVALLGAALSAITFTNSDTESDADIDVCIGRTGLVAA